MRGFDPRCTVAIIVRLSVSEQLGAQGVSEARVRAANSVIGTNGLG